MRRSAPSFAMVKPRNLRSSGCATALFASLTFSFRGQEPGHRGHDPFASAAAANIDVAVIRVTAKPVPTPAKLLIEIVEHEIAEQR